MVVDSPSRQAPWPPDDIQQIVDALGDGLLVVEPTGRILYANPAAEDMLSWPSGGITGKAIEALLGPKSAEWRRRFESILKGDPSELLGKPLDVSLVTPDGNEIQVELVVSTGSLRSGDQVLIGVLRPQHRQLAQRLSTFTQQLLDVLTASSSEAPTEQLLGALGRRLTWDVAALWGLEADGSLICRGVWTTPDAPAQAFVEEKLRHPDHDSGGLARLVMERGEPAWFTDLASNARFTSQAIRSDGLVSACAFPIRYSGQCVGAVKMMSRAKKQPDPDMIELIGAVSGHIGEILHALEQAAERDMLVEELESTQRRLQFLLRANRIVSQATDYVETLERLAEVAVPALGDLCLIDVTDEDGLIRRLVSRHADRSKRHLADELLAHYAPDPRGQHPSADVMNTGESRWSAEMTDELLRATCQDERHFAILKELSFTSYMTVPLMVGDEVRGTVTLVSAGSGRRYSVRELKGAEELAGQIAGVVERARVLDREHHNSHTLQRSLLPARLPQVSGLMFAARYVPAANDVEVGGDWYDVVSLDGSSAALVVGDVQGHDMVAASVMGQLRHGLSLLLSEGATPSDALNRVNAFLIASDIEHIATVLVATIEPSSGLLRLASAGHPSPIAAGSGGVRSMNVRPGPPLGAGDACFEELATSLDEETLVLFTDGLVERRYRHPDEGMDLLFQAAGAREHRDPDALVDHLLAELMTDDRGADDVAILAVRRAK
jgi:PAS domain S-box-containing protein